MRIIIDTQSESREGIIAAIRMLKALLEESSDGKGGTPDAKIGFKEEGHSEGVKIEQGFINILSGDELKEMSKKEDNKSEGIDFETY